MVRAAGLEPAQLLRAEGFSYQLRLSPPRFGAFAPWLVCGLDYTFIVGALAPLDAARLVSTPSHRPFGPGRLARDCHVKGFPEFEQFCIPGFPESTQSLKSLASTDSAMPAYVSEDQIVSAFTGEVE